MNDAEQYASAVARCETSAGNHGHALGVWYPVSEQFRASMCEACDAMAWVTRPGYEEHWRIGGSALEQACSVEDQRAASGD